MKYYRVVHLKLMFLTKVTLIKLFLKDKNIPTEFIEGRELFKCIRRVTLKLIFTSLRTHYMPEIVPATMNTYLPLLTSYDLITPMLL